jgi:vesicular inhibitory amino acid transporter
LSFLIATSSISGLGVLGAYMFGDATASQVTLSMPLRLITTKIVLWMTVLTPMFKFALQLSPITTALETWLYQRCRRRASGSVLFGMSTLMRSMVLATIAIFSMVFPYFEYIVALVGSSMTIAICLLFPCAFYLKLYWEHLHVAEKIMIFTMIAIGIVIGMYGTIVSVDGLIHKSRG